ncbi:MAG: DUF2017 family protein [Acidimicrobiia bacterium]
MKIKPVRNGVEVKLDRGIVEFLLQFADMLDGIQPGSDDPAANRLHVPVYLDDPDANGEWWQYMGSELDESRRADRSAYREALSASVKGTVVSKLEAYAMVRVLNESRLALAARVGVEIEDDYERLGDHEAMMLQALAELQMGFLQALAP